MKLYEIDEALYNLIDKETGEIKDYEAFEKLEMDRNEKIESTCLWIKDIKGDIEKLDNEIERLKSKKQTCENSINSLRFCLGRTLNGKKFKTPKISVYYKSNEKVVLDEQFIDWAKNNADDLLKYKDPEASLTSIKQAINGGRKIKHAEIQKNKSMCIK